MIIGLQHGFIIFTVNTLSDLNNIFTLILVLLFFNSTIPPDNLPFVVGLTLTAAELHVCLKYLVFKVISLLCVSTRKIKSTLLCFGWSKTFLIFFRLLGEIRPLQFQNITFLIGANSCLWNLPFLLLCSLFPSDTLNVRTALDWPPSGQPIENGS